MVLRSEHRPTTPSPSLTKEGSKLARIPTGGAYVPTLVVGMYASLEHQKGADMPKNGTSAPPAVFVLDL